MLNRRVLAPRDALIVKRNAMSAHRVAHSVALPWLEAQHVDLGPVQEHSSRRGAQRITWVTGTASPAVKATRSLVDDSLYGSAFPIAAIERRIDSLANAALSTYLGIREMEVQPTAPASRMVSRRRGAVRHSWTVEA